MNIQRIAARIEERAIAAQELEADPEYRVGAYESLVLEALEALGGKSFFARTIQLELGAGRCLSSQEVARVRAAVAEKHEKRHTGGTFRITSDGEETVCTVADFVRDNAEDTDLLRTALALAVGERSSFGGGAAPLVIVERMS